MSLLAGAAPSRITTGELPRAPWGLEAPSPPLPSRNRIAVRPSKAASKQASQTADRPFVNRFLFLGRRFNHPSLPAALSLAAKVTLNQLVFAPLFNCYFFGMQALLSGDHSLRQAADHVRRTVPVSWVNSCKVWPAVTAFSFTFVGERNRALFAGRWGFLFFVGVVGMW